MQIPSTALRDITVSRFLLGGNPFSGFSHQSEACSAEMRRWYSDERIIEVLFQAQDLGLDALILRGDDHITNILHKYWRRGGTMRWVAQTDSQRPPAEAATYCLDHGAVACFLHGGVTDHCIAQGDLDGIARFARTVRDSHKPVGIAGHVPEDFIRAEHNLDLDFYMVCYYNPSPRQEMPHHDQRAVEYYLESDRAERVATIQKLGRPVIHYKILAAGRNDPAQAFAFATRHMRLHDAVCVGIYTKDNPAMLEEDLGLFLKGLEESGQYP